MKSTRAVPLATDEAWRLFEEWERTRRQIGVIFTSASASSVYTMGFVESARNGRLVLKGTTLRASFNLALASFTYGPVATWPKWPGPPIVELTAVEARLENGDWLILAEGLRPESLPPVALPE